MRICKVEGCENKHCAKGYCKKHYYQIQRNGNLAERTIYDPNELIIENDICRIFLYDRYGNKKAEAIIDIEDIPKIQGKKWGLEKGYPISTTNGKIYLHQLILGKAPKGKEIDHKNTNPLDNRRDSLRFCTHAQNLQNSNSKVGTSIYKGVNWDKNRKKWFACIRVDNKTIGLGRFIDESKAAKAYDKMALKLFGKFSRLNFSQGM
jgi:hypothetical protein